MSKVEEMLKEIDWGSSLKEHEREWRGDDRKCDMESNTRKSQKREKETSRMKI